MNDRYKEPVKVRKTPWLDTEAIRADLGGISQSELARLLGVVSSVVNRHEKGTKQMSEVAQRLTLAALYMDQENLLVPFLTFVKSYQLKQRKTPGKHRDLRAALRPDHSAQE